MYLQRVIHSTKYLRQARQDRFYIKLALQEVVIRLHQPQKGLYVLPNLAVTEQVTLPGQSFFLQEAVSCLITNAFAAYGSRREKQVVLTCYQHQSNLVLQVSDFGSGMDWLTHRLAAKGILTPRANFHGHGLQFVKDVVQRLYRGQLYIQSLRDMGTVVTCILPMSAKTKPKP
jgi:C4-dicarboxylate-specific signal transduction histidine kinase